MLKKTFLLLGLLAVSNITLAELKIGFVNVPKVLESAPQAAKAKKRLEREFSPKDKQLVAQQKAIKKLQEKLSRDAAVMSEKERQSLERKIISKSRDAQRAQAEFSEDFNVRRNEELGKLQKRIVEVINKIAKAEKFDMLLTSGVIYASRNVDMTDRVKKKLATMP